MAIGSSGCGTCQGFNNSGEATSESVSPVSARLSFATAQMSPATQVGTDCWVLPNGEESEPMRSSTSWSSCMLPAAKCPDTCPGASGRSVPLNTRTNDNFPT